MSQATLSHLNTVGRLAEKLGQPKSRVEYLLPTRWHRQLDSPENIFGFQIGDFNNGTMSGDTATENSDDGFQIGGPGPSGGDGFNLSNTATFGSNVSTDNTAQGYNIEGTPQTGKDTNTGSVSPRRNETSGRDHWSRAMSIFLSGGGLKMGQVVDATNPCGEHPVERTMDSNCLLAVIYRRFGIDT